MSTDPTEHLPPAIALTGPTASGKTGIGILMAETLRTEIINVDSRQIYRGMDIGTDKPSPADRARGESIQFAHAGIPLFPSHKY